MPIVQANGNQVEYESVGEGPTLVLLHTLLADRTVYDRVVPELSARQSVITPNFPGNGRSTGPISDRIEAYGDVVARFLDALKIDRTDLLGNGFGGFVATSVALRHPDRVDRLMLVDTGPGFPEPAKEPLRILRSKVLSDGMESVLDAAMQRMFPKSFIEARPDVIAERKASLAKADPELFATACAALVELDHRPRLGEIPHETLVMVGLEDETTPPALSRELAEGLPNAQLVELPGIGHCPQIQAHDAFVTHVLKFLSR